MYLFCAKFLYLSVVHVVECLPNDTVNICQVVFVLLPPSVEQVSCFIFTVFIWEETKPKECALQGEYKTVVNACGNLWFLWEFTPESHISLWEGSVSSVQMNCPAIAESFIALIVVCLPKM